MATKKNTRKKVTPAKSAATPTKKRVSTRSSKSSTTPLSTSKTSTVSETPKQRRFQIKRSYAIAALVILLLAGLLYLSRSLFVAAMVNGQPISRMSVISELEKQSGKQALDTLVTKTLIQQEARKQNVTVNQDEINQEMKKIEDNVKKQGQTLDQVLSLQGMDRKGLEDQIRIQKTVEKILGKDIQVTDKEVTDYITANQEALGLNPEAAETKTQVKDQLTQQKLSEKFQAWIQNLQKNANINYFVSY